MGNSNLTYQDIKYNVLKKLFDVETNKEVKMKLLRSMLEITAEKTQKTKSQ